MLRLWNPSVRKSLIIPFIPSDFKWETYVLGFSPSSNDYKVVAFDFDRDGNVYAVYSISTNTWRIKPCPSNSLPLFVLEAGGNLPLYDSPHFCQGAVHWMVCGSVPNIYTHVLSFEFDTEDFHIVELPDSAGEVEMCRGLTTVGEELAVFGISALNCCIWVMRKEGGEKLWSLRFSGDSCLDSYNFVARDCYFLKRFYYEQKTGVISLVTSGQGMKSYNISTQRRQHLFNSVSRSIAYMDAYVESLVWFP
ncbi:hypothetical protein SOVF_081380 [Spinacia oleracea]|nr:hypothetical protein SOVF_081380 [Spinacia oleracea]